MMMVCGWVGVGVRWEREGSAGGDDRREHGDARHDRGTAARVSEYRHRAAVMVVRRVGEGGVKEGGWGL